VNAATYPKVLHVKRAELENQPIIIILGKKYAKSVGRSTISKGIKHGKMLN